MLLETLPTQHEVIGNVDNNRVNIIRSGNRLTAFIKGLNIRITVYWHGRYMNYDLKVPRFLCEISYGHLGNCDGNPNNDVSGPNDCE